MKVMSFLIVFAGLLASGVQVLNSGFESYDANALPLDWDISVGSCLPGEYEAVTSTNYACEGSRSLRMGYASRALEDDKYLKIRQELNLEVKKRYLFELNYTSEYLGRVLNFVGANAHIEEIGHAGFGTPGEWSTLKYEWEIPDDSSLLANGTVPFSVLVRTYTTNLYLDDISVTEIQRSHEQSSLTAANSMIEAETNALKSAISTIRGKLDAYKAANDAAKPWFYLQSLCSVLERAYEYVIEDYERNDLWYANRSIRQLNECNLLEMMAYDIIDGIDGGDPAVIEANKTYIYDGDVSEVNGRFFRSSMKFHKGWSSERDMVNVGLLGFAGFRDDFEFLGQDALGCNMVSVNVAPKNICAGEDAAGIIQINTNELNTKVVAPLVDAANRGLQVSVVLGGVLPDWFVSEYGSDVVFSGLGFYSYDVNHAEVRRLYEGFVDAVMAAVTNRPALHSIIISNEPRLEVVDATESTHFHNQWKAYLQEKFPGGIAEYNSATGLAYSSWDDVPVSVDGDLADPGMVAANVIYDGFIRDYFKEFHLWLAGLIKAKDADLNLHSKITLANRLDGDEALAGNCIEDWCEFSDILGNDMKYYPNPQNVDAVWASSCSLKNAMLLDLQGSLKTAPIFNSEAHLIPNGYSSDMQDNHVYTAIWHAAMHGQTAAVAWLWERWVDGVNLGLKGSIAHSPRQLYGLVKAQHDLNRLVYKVMPFVNAEKEVALVYSRPSLLGNPGRYYRRLAEAYEALSANGYHVGFITETQMENNQFGLYKAVVCAGLTHLSQAALLNLKNWEAQTSAVNIFKYGVNIFKYDDLGGVHASVDKPASTFISYTAATPNRLTYFRNELQAIDGLYKNVYVKELIGGSWAWPQDGTLEWRLVEVNGIRYVSVINFSQSAKTVHLERLSSGSMSDLITGGSLGAYNSSFTIAPMMPRLLCVE